MISIDLTQEMVCGEPGPNLFMYGSKLDGAVLLKDLEKVRDGKNVSLTKDKYKLNNVREISINLEISNDFIKIIDDKIEVNVDMNTISLTISELKNALNGSGHYTIYVEYENSEVFLEDANWIIEV